jgi:hypothetical protein
MASLKKALAAASMKAASIGGKKGGPGDKGKKMKEKNLEEVTVSPNMYKNRFQAKKAIRKGETDTAYVKKRNKITGRDKTLTFKDEFRDVNYLIAGGEEGKASGGRNKPKLTSKKVVTKTGQMDDRINKALSGQSGMAEGSMPKSSVALNIKKASRTKGSNVGSRKR